MERYVSACAAFIFAMLFVIAAVSLGENVLGEQFEAVSNGRPVSYDLKQLLIHLLIMLVLVAGFIFGIRGARKY